MADSRQNFYSEGFLMFNLLIQKENLEQGDYRLYYRIYVEYRLEFLE
jgi:hypothetical protein